MSDTIDYCSKLIDTNIEPNCQDMAKGFEKSGVIVNRADIDWSTVKYDATYPNIVTDFALLTGKKGYSATQMSAGAFGDTTTKSNAGTYMTTFNNEFHLMIFDASPKAAKIVDELANGEFVFIVQQKQKDLQNTETAYKGYSAYRIYGLEQGLKMGSDTENTPTSDDGNNWKVVLKEEGSIKSAYYMFKTDYATTQAAVEALKA